MSGISRRRTAAPVGRPSLWAPGERAHSSRDPRLRDVSREVFSDREETVGARIIVRISRRLFSIFFFFYFPIKF